jgi:chromosome segregation ATPase
MAEPPAHDDDPRVEELLRVNAELAGEIRALELGRVSAPRSGTVPSARRLAKLQSERDALFAERERLGNELAAALAEQDRLEHHNRELGRRMHDQAQELERMRSGLAGFLARARARLARRRGVD